MPEWQSQRLVSNAGPGITRGSCESLHLFSFPSAPLPFASEVFAGVNLLLLSCMEEMLKLEALSLGRCQLALQQ